MGFAALCGASRWRNDSRTIRADFVTWTQGLRPHEAGQAKVDEYVETVAPRSWARADLEEVFTEWLREIRAEEP